MRRRPTAVYRVIDEEELLGGDGLDIGSTTVSGAGPVPTIRTGAAGRRSAQPWLAAGVGVAGLVALGIALLAALSTPRRAAAGALPPAAPLLRAVRPRAAAPTAMPRQRRRRVRRRARSHRAAAVRGGVGMHRHVVVRAVVPTAAPPPSAAPTRHPAPSPAVEFGFER